jgi:hypothetical protein
MVRRQASYQWRLRETMATRGIFTATELVPLPAERGITLSASQVHRLVSGTPERVSLLPSGVRMAGPRLVRLSRARRSSPGGPGLT